MTKKDKMLCIAAGQRTGTTALRSALATTGQFENYGEIFHLDNETYASFLKFCSTRKILLTDLAKHEQTKKISDQYIQHIYSLSEAKFAMIDVKLNSWNAIRPFWFYPHQMPFFMRQLLENGCFFVFIRRNNLWDQLASELIARSTGKWHNLHRNYLHKKIHINISEFKNHGRLTLQSEALIWSYLVRTNKAVGLEYEDLYEFDGAVNRDLLRTLSNEFNINFTNKIMPKIEKNKLDKKQIIENYDESREAIAEILAKYPRPQLLKLNINM